MAAADETVIGGDCSRRRLVDMRWEEYPPALRVVRSNAGVIFYLVVLGIGIAAVAMGSVTGRIVGVVLTAVCLAVAVRLIRWRRRSLAEPSEQ